jgi:allantoin racemase
MKVLLFNPNTTASMTDEMAAGARRVAAPDTEIVALTAERGPASVDCYLDETVAAGVVAEAAVANRDLVDAMVIACFGDPGLMAAREVLDGPVVGIAEAAMLASFLIGQRFAILTTLARGVPPLWDVVRLYGFQGRCAGIGATGLTVLEADADPERACAALVEAGRHAVREWGADVLLLGCGGMVDLPERVARGAGAPVVDGVTAAVKLAESLVTLKLRTSRARGLARPQPNAWQGMPSDFDRLPGARVTQETLRS